MTIRSVPRPVLLRPESELLVWCARTVLTDVLKESIRQRVLAPLDWRLVLDLAEYHGVGPLLYRSLSVCCSDRVPEDSMSQLRHRTQAGAMLNRVLTQELLRLYEAFAAQSVPVIPIKGATLAISAYGDLTLRDFNDLDLVIQEDSLVNAQAVLLGLGYERKDAPAEPVSADHDEGAYHVFIKRQTCGRVDLQWRMAAQYFEFRLDRPEFWQRRTSVSLANKKAVLGLAPEDLLIVLCVHGSKHAWEALKWVCDVAELLRAQEHLGWDQVFSNASAWGCQRLVFMGLSLAHQLLDAPLPAAVMARLSTDFDVQALSSQMPDTLLADRGSGVNEGQAVALYFSLKDSWWERWRLGVLLCRDQSPLIKMPPPWFRWGASLQRLARLTSPVQRVTRNMVPSKIRGAINHWVEHGG